MHRYQRGDECLIMQFLIDWAEMRLKCLSAAAAGLPPPLPRYTMSIIQKNENRNTSLT